MSKRRLSQSLTSLQVALIVCNFLITSLSNKCSLITSGPAKAAPAQVEVSHHIGSDAACGSFPDNPEVMNEN